MCHWNIKESMKIVYVLICLQKISLVNGSARLEHDKQTPCIALIREEGNPMEIVLPMSVDDRITGNMPVRPPDLYAFLSIL